MRFRSSKSVKPPSISPWGAAYLFDDFQLAKHTNQRFDRTIHLFVSVRSHQRNAHERIGGMASRRHNGVDEDTGFESHCRCGERLFQVTKPSSLKRFSA